MVRQTVSAAWQRTFPRYFATDPPSLSEMPPEYVELFLTLTSRIKKNNAGSVTPCLCGSQNSLLIATRERHGLPAKTFLCVDCGVLRLHPQPTAAELTEFYGSEFRMLYDDLPSSRFRVQQAQGERYLDCLVRAGVKPGVVWDVGCGTGGTLIPFQASGWHVAGVDFDERYLAEGRAGGLKLFTGSWESLEQGAAIPAPTLVLFSHSLEHLADIPAALTYASEKLAEGGHALIALPGVFSIHKTYVDPMDFFHVAHLFSFSLAGLSRLMARFGFSLVAGNESIVALYRKEPVSSEPNTRGEWLKILGYLAVSDRMRPMFGALKKIARRVKTPNR